GLLASGATRTTKAGGKAKRLAPVLKPEWFQDDRTDELLHQIETYLAKTWEARGHPEEEIQAVQQQEREERRLCTRRGEAYAGWLILNPQFREELHTLQARCRGMVARRGGFPRPGAGAEGGGGAAPCCGVAGGAACLAFCRRWGLDRMLTWELPAARDARLHYLADEESGLSSAEGVTLVVPWYLLRGGQFDLRQVA